MSVDEVEAADGAFHGIADDGLTQVERVVGDGLGDVACLVFHHLLVVDPHLRFHGLRLHGVLKSMVCGGVDKRGQVLQHEVQTIDGQLGLQLI